MANLVDQFPKSGEMVVGPLFGTLATAKAHLELQQHCRSVDCKVDANFFTASLKALADTYSRQVLNEKAVISGDAGGGGCTQDIGSRA